jgi:hypothetical protein
MERRKAYRVVLGVVLVIGAAGLAGCGDWPDSVDSAEDVERIDPDTAVLWARFLPDDELHALEGLRRLAHIDFWAGCGLGEAALTDEGLARLSELDLPHLYWLNLGLNGNITDAGIEHLAGMTGLERLALPGCPRLTDVSLEYISEMDELRYLDLRGCEGIGDEGLEQLQGLESLERVLLGGCWGVSPEAVRALQRALPDCSVEMNDGEWTHHVPGEGLEAALRDWPEGRREPVRIRPERPDGRPGGT